MTARLWIGAGALVLIALEVLAVLYWVPASTLTISVEEAYRTVSFSAIATFAGVGALVSAIVTAITIKLLPQLAGLWQVVNAGALVAGCIAAIFVVVIIATGFGYISLYDDDPGNFTGSTNWPGLLNGIGSVLVFGALLSMAARYFSRTWKPAR